MYYKQGNVFIWDRNNMIKVWRLSWESLESSWVDKNKYKIILYAYLQPTKKI